jgi:hypothetical protein
MTNVSRFEGVSCGDERPLVDPVAVGIHKARCVGLKPGECLNIEGILEGIALGDGRAGVGTLVVLLQLSLERYVGQHTIDGVYLGLPKYKVLHDTFVHEHGTGKV